MRSFLCKPFQLCSSVLSELKDVPSKQQQQLPAMPSLLSQLQTARDAEKAGERKSKNKGVPTSAQRNLDQKETLNEQEISNLPAYRKTHTSQKALQHQKKTSSSNSKRRHNAHQEFQRAMAMAGGKIYTDHESLPSYENSLACFKDMYPRYSETAAMDTLRWEEYKHLNHTGHVCLDYCGFGLFSHLQQVEQWDSASFALSNISVNLCSHALFGAADDGTVECDIRKRIMGYLNINEADYCMVFTASRGASFKLLADVYPFETCSRLITMYDYESESVSWMVQRAKEKGAKISNVIFKLPSLRIVSTKLRKLLVAKRRRRGLAKGLFVFPVQSRVSGAKYSYQWMSLAQQNKWHVLLDASAIGPKDMDSLGLSLFRPDFIVASFYKLFGGDPSGFGCLFIKNSVVQTIQDESGVPASGIVRLIPYPDVWSLSQSSDGDQAENELEEGEYEGQELTDFELQIKSNGMTAFVASFSGPMLGFNKQSPYGDRLPRIEGVMEEDDDDDSSVLDSVGEVTRSPVFSEDGTDNVFCIDVGRSPVGTASRTSMSEDPFSGPFSGQFSGPFSGPIHNSVYDGETLSNLPGTTHHNPLFENNSNVINGSKSVGGLDKESQILEKEVDDRRVSDSESEDMSAGVLISSKPLKQNIRGVELLDPGTSPFAGSGSASMVNIYGAPKQENENSENTVRDVQKKHARSRTDKVFPSAGEGSPQASGVDDQKQSNTEIQAYDSMNDLGKDKLDIKQKLKGKAAENAIRRETEGDFRLLGRRNGVRLMVGRTLSPILQDSEELDSAGGRGSYAGADYAGEICSTSYQDQEETRSYVGDGAGESDVKEPEVVCRSLDHADTLGLNKTTLRLRYLINWLISSLLQLRHPGPQDNLSLVQLYGPQMRYDRGASVAFNLYDCHGKMLHPELVQMLADKNCISLSIGFLRNLQSPDSSADISVYATMSRNVHGRGEHRRRVPLRIEVVTASLSILSDFEDVYRLWVFVARFLDADFVSKELGGQPPPVGDVIS